MTMSTTPRHSALRRVVVSAFSSPMAAVLSLLSAQ